ncbi:MAG: type VI secretion system-associated FHA domain protein TagH [Granulosicoccus sp.]|nr:type VI secretion system-associated FHA domain protein TagH [Granulosicoccus sp.]
MRLTLQVRSYCDQPPTDPQERHFDTFPILLGRSTACDYSLDDASRYISSNHAVIAEENGRLVIQDTSANGVYVNGAAEPVGRGRSVNLTHHDTLAIGDYLLTVSIESADSEATRPAHDDPFAELSSGSVNAASSSAPAGYDPFRGDEPDWTPPSAASDDPFGDDWEMNDTSASPGGAATDSVDDEWADWPDSRDQQAGDPPAGGRRSRPAAAAQPVDNDDLDWLPGTSSETVSFPPPTADDGQDPGIPGTRPRRRGGSADSDIPTPPSAPRVEGHPGRVPPAAHERPRHEPPRRRTAGSPSVSLEPLLRAATLRESDFTHLSEEEVLAQTGRLLSQMVDAMMVLLQSRTELKNAIRSDVTTLSRSGNNPLKFSFSAADALTKLLSNETDGYLQSDVAVQEAVDDLKLHQLAMLEGMKSAVRSMLLQFDPEKLARKLEKSGGISANIPITREAKLWELFCEQYEAIREEAVSDFGELFGSEFRKAYEKRIRQMGRKPDF